MTASARRRADLPPTSRLAQDSRAIERQHFRSLRTCGDNRRLHIVTQADVDEVRPAGPYIGAAARRSC